MLDKYTGDTLMTRLKAEPCLAYACRCCVKLEMVLFDEILKKGLSVTITDKVKVIHHLILGNLLYCLFAVNEAIRSFRLLQCKISSPACGTTLMTSNSLTWDTAIDINSPQSIGFL